MTFFSLLNSTLPLCKVCFPSTKGSHATTMSLPYTHLPTVSARNQTATPSSYVVAGDAEKTFSALPIGPRRYLATLQDTPPALLSFLHGYHIALKPTPPLSSNTPHQLYHIHFTRPHCHSHCIHFLHLQTIHTTVPTKASHPIFTHHHHQSLWATATSLFP